MDGRRAPNRRGSYVDRLNHEQQRSFHPPPARAFPVFGSSSFMGPQVVSDMRTARSNEDLSGSYEAWADFSSSQMRDRIRHRLPHEETEGDGTRSDFYGFTAYTHPRIPPRMYYDVERCDPSVLFSAGSSTANVVHSRNGRGLEDAAYHPDHPVDSQAPSEPSYRLSGDQFLSPSQMQMVRYDPDHARDRTVSPPSSSHELSNHTSNGRHLFPRSPNWSTESNFGSGRSLASSQSATSNDSSGYTGGSSSGYVGPYRAPYGSYRDHGDVFEDDGDNMSDGIASDEGVYDSSSSSRGVSGGDSDSHYDVFSDEGYSSDDYYHK